ncbi:MAG: Omp28-related outer membrane protein [Bacteroidales bacterium]|jgi:hypothetical protein|nr:Omp28-related outer membrane protein [Bacteroidales bacterium]
MKKILFLLSLLCLIIIACDKIDGPYLAINPAVEPISIDSFPPLTQSVIHKFLMEEFTGHKCSNCPQGHALLRNLLAIYGDTMITIGIHAGSLSVTDAEYPYDFRTNVGNQLFTDFPPLGVPSVFVNRTGAVLWNNANDWQDAIIQRDRTTPVAAIQIINVYDELKQKVTANAKITMLQDYANPINISFYLIENKIIKPQLSGTTRIPNYEHNHVLRASLDGTTYGLLLSGTGTANGATFLKAYDYQFYGTDRVPENCKIVVFLSDASSKQILQVEEAEVKTNEQ